MFVLVDYDNIQQSIRRKGVSDVIDIIMSSIFKGVLIKGERLNFRLYGGWYEGDSLSQRAQEMVSELQDKFPFVTKDGNLKKYFVNVELAYSLSCDPERHLFNTYRKKSSPRGIKVYGPESCPALGDSCCVRGLKKFIERGVCPESGCGQKIGDKIWRSEQKMVDTMLTSDLLTFCIDEQGHQVCVVTSDDDLWPPLRTSLHFSKEIFHMPAIPGREIPGHYRSGVDGFVSIELRV